MKYFTINELIKSDSAKRSRINNTPTKQEEANLIALVENILDPLREAYGKPIKVNSGYRCPALNKAVGGSKTSSHLTGLGADITAGSPEKNKILFNLVQELNLPFDQLIDERKFKWIHVSYSRTPRKQVLHL